MTSASRSMFLWQCHLGFGASSIAALFPEAFISFLLSFNSGTFRNIIGQIKEDHFVLQRFQRVVTEPIAHFLFLRQEQTFLPWVIHSM